MTAQASNGPTSNPGPGHLSDPEIMLKLRDGDAAALGVLVDRYWEPLVRYAARLLESVDAAEDMVQEAFVTVWRERTAWRPIGTPKAFLYRIVRNHALQELRKRDVRQRTAPEIARRRPAVWTPLEDAAAEELDRAVRRALAALPDRRREAFSLARYHDLSHIEIAEIMGVSTQTVANHVSMAVAELRRALERFLT